MSLSWFYFCLPTGCYAAERGLETHQAVPRLSHGFIFVSLWPVTQGCPAEAARHESREAGHTGCLSCNAISCWRGSSCQDQPKGRRKRASRLGTVLPTNKRAELISRQEKDEARLAAEGERSERLAAPKARERLASRLEVPAFLAYGCVIKDKTRRRRRPNTPAATLMSGVGLTPRGERYCT